MRVHVILTNDDLREKLFDYYDEVCEFDQLFISLHSYILKKDNHMVILADLMDMKSLYDCNLCGYINTLNYDGIQLTCETSLMNDEWLNFRYNLHRKVLGSEHWIYFK